jgi:hypothetical protein
LKKKNLIARGVLGVLFFSLVLSQVVLADEVYVWQRQWTPELSQAIRDQSTQFEGLRILGTQYLNADRWIEPKLDWAALKSTHLPLVLVLRLPGSEPLLPASKLGQKIVDIHTVWVQAGLKPTSVEIDFDCAESKLSAYREQLHELRQYLPQGLGLQITALPAWLKTTEFSFLMSEVDHVTLQVHGVSKPSQGLFDPVLAERWIRRMSVLSTKSFSVALPAYGAGLLLDHQGGVVGVEHETKLSTHHTKKIELTITPTSVRLLLDRLSTRPVHGLKNYIWFRLPLLNDTRAWAPATLKAVMHREVLRAEIRADFFANAAGGYDVRLRNSATLMDALPKQIEVNNKCSGEGIGGYRYVQGSYRLIANGVLKPGQTRVIGWLRCPGTELPSVAVLRE